MSFKKNFTAILLPVPSTPNTWLIPLKDSDYLQHSNKMLGKQPYIQFISLAFCNPAKSEAPAKSFT